MGRPRVCPDEVVERVVYLKRQGLSDAKIAAAMQRDGYRTPMGRPRWWQNTVTRLLSGNAAKSYTASSTRPPAPTATAGPNLMTDLPAPRSAIRLVCNGSSSNCVPRSCSRSNLAGRTRRRLDG
jgi:hypothetical protein